MTDLSGIEKGKGLVYLGMTIGTCVEYAGTEMIGNERYFYAVFTASLRRARYLAESDNKENHLLMSLGFDAQKTGGRISIRGGLKTSNSGNLLLL